MRKIVTENIIYMAMVTSDQQWQTFSRDAKLSENTVHVWRAALHTPTSVVQYYQRHLMPALSFNISHAHDLALFAFTYDRQVGVDVEYMRLGDGGDDYEQLAQHYFSPYERTVFQTLRVKEKRQAFFQCWTRKEASIKARGMGLSLPLDLFDVSLRPNEPAALLQSREHPQEATRWSMRELLPGTGYVGALVVEGKDWHLHCWQWDI